MDNTLLTQEFKEIFQNSLKLNARSLSVKTLLSERNLQRIDYSPYYQRNYVWDNEKQTFFIESVILGTEIPPLILFKTGNKIEVIDGRQRFETLKRFKENEITLKISGLKELQILSKLSFNKLTDELKEVFLDSNVRVYEFEVINNPNINEGIIDKVKKEIFRRYNTGITPLSREELDNAKYDADEFSDLFKEELKYNHNFLLTFNKCFFPKDVVSNDNNEGLIAKNVDFIRRYRILNKFPISTYAGSDRTETIDLLYEFIKDSSEDPQTDYSDFHDLLSLVLNIYKDMAQEIILQNRLIYDCILWAVTILKQEQIVLSYDQIKFKQHYIENIANYSEDSSHYYGSIIKRFSDTARFFESIHNVDFSIYIRDEDFKKRISKLKQTEVDAAKSIEELSHLRLNKPNPISTPIDEIRNDLRSARYLLRPSYQRQEKINVVKASSIIESILLGINIPPIFIYKRKDNIKEVVDGQQRLLAIIGYLGSQFYNENGTLTYSKNNSFKLKGLKILTNLEGSNYTSLPVELKDKILDFVIDMVIIEESFNDKFDPVDLFIRLNYKPYPIKGNSFEMWNSIVNYVVIKRIKEISSANTNNEWFFLRETIAGKPDRMLNEELITILSYICFTNKINPDEEVIGFFPRQDRITCRLKDKKGLGDFLIGLDSLETDRLSFLKAIERTNQLITKFASLFPIFPTKDSLNEFLNVKKSTNFRRSLQDFYVIWIVLDKINDEKYLAAKHHILKDIKCLLCLLRNQSDQEINDKYFDTFLQKLEEISLKYS